MALKTGTHTIADLAANQFAGEPAVDNIDALNEAVAADLAAHNAQVAQMTADLAETSTERSTVYGTSAQGEAVPADEFTRGPTQKLAVGGKVEFPLEKFQYPIGWTSDYLRRASVQDIALGTIAARQAHLARISKDVRDALFGPANYTFRDRFVDNMDLAVKRLVNADGAPIPNGPNGEEFTPGTHTHYDAIAWAGADAAARAAALRALVQDVVEHGHGDDVRIYINRAQESDVRALDGFEPLPVPNMTFRSADTATGTLDITRADNRLIGFFDGFPVSTKPWVPASYVLAFAAGGRAKTLRIRQSAVAGEQGLFVAGEIIMHPLQARYMEFFHGVGVLTRTNGAVLYLGGATYQAPAL
jgi:hypothetical protein